MEAITKAKEYLDNYELEPLLLVDLVPLLEAAYLETKQINYRLQNANRHFRRKAAAVFNDNDALELIARLRTSIVEDQVDFNFAKEGKSLAKLTAANFAEIGASGIYITASGMRFVDTLMEVPPVNL